MQNLSKVNITLSEAYRCFRIYKNKLPLDQQKKIKSSHLLTAKHLLFLNLKKWNNSSIEQKNQGIYLNTNKPGLAKECLCDRRTIGNHLNRLEEIGIIQKREVLHNEHGRWAGVRIKINPECFINEKVLGRKKIPHLVLEALETNKYKRAQNSTPRTISKNIEELARVEVQRVPSKERTSTRHSILTLRVWEYAKSTLFWDKEVKKPKKEQILDLLSKQLNEEFWKQKPENRNPELIFKRNINRIDRANSWMVKRNLKYTPDPLYYFTKSDNGFRFNRLAEWEKKVSSNNATHIGFEESVSIDPELNLTQIISQRAISNQLEIPKFNPTRINLNSSKCSLQK